MNMDYYNMGYHNGYRDATEKAKAEIERLKECPKCVYEFDGEVMEFCSQSPCTNYKTADEIRTEAIKEFAERLKVELANNLGCPITDTPRITIDNLVKEMVGDRE